ncbi:glutathione S-transferase [Psychrosphaera saromensis]|uniref:Glutathione S-transferase n=1 Tax=Psychrosphaera saromensis TaxID=716813 RepID=A0A2S7UQE2_9GAMM|nr:glutathione S-transferase [Psychrosphaera saromensis]PQJ52204.1 glutathione S-transferase [Psychrosphaera saromensis]GHB79179.1 glutathione S-transferase [Psychrosphaera saromensis]GLQ13716.1 glutathione S-transferase [Psychrosphaera saromensis]
MKENLNKANELPILYSLRNCPFAMRARLAIFRSQTQVILRSIVLNDKPADMLTASPKGTVPVLVLPPTINLEDKGENEKPEQVIDESFDVMVWALTQNDPDNLLHSQDSAASTDMFALVAKFDNEFKSALEDYKAAKRYHEDNLVECRQVCETYIADLEQRLTAHSFLVSNQESFADLALLPFIRQFAKIERQWYLQSPYPNLQKWLNSYLQSLMFSKVMVKHPLYLSSDEVIYLN